MHANIHTCMQPRTHTRPARARPTAESTPESTALRASRHRRRVWHPPTQTHYRARGTTEPESRSDSPTETLHAVRVTELCPSVTRALNDPIARAIQPPPRPPPPPPPIRDGMPRLGGPCPVRLGRVARRRWFRHHVAPPTHRRPGPGPGDFKFGWIVYVGAGCDKGDA